MQAISFTELKSLLLEDPKARAIETTFDNKNDLKQRRRNIGIPYYKSKELERKIDQGDQSANFDMGVLLTIEGNKDEARDCFVRARQSNCPAAFSALADIEIKNNNSQDALKLYYQGAKFGDVEASCKLGFFYLYGKLGLPINEQYAKSYFELAASQGSTTGNYLLGFLYENGIGVQVEQQKAKDFYTQSQTLGSHLASKKLASIDGDKSTGNDQEEDSGLNSDEQNTVLYVVLSIVVFSDAVLLYLGRLEAISWITGITSFLMVIFCLVRNGKLLKE